MERIGWLKHIDFDERKSVEEALELIGSKKQEATEADFYGDGHVAEKIVDALEEVIK